MCVPALPLVDTLPLCPLVPADLSLSAQALKLFVTLCTAKPDAAAAVADAALPAALSLVTSPLLQVRRGGVKVGRARGERGTECVGGAEQGCARGGGQGW